MSLINSVNTLTIYFFAIYFIIILQTTPGSSEWSLPFRTFDWTFLRIPQFSCHP